MAHWQDYKVGGKDKKDRVIEEIFSFDDDYIIYSSGNQLRFEGKTEQLDQTPDLANLLSQIISLSPSRESLKKRVWTRTATALDQCLSDRQAEARDILQDILRYVTFLRTLRGQIHYFLGCLAGAVLPVVVLIAVASVRYSIYPSGETPSQWSLALQWVQEISEVTALAALGGTLSVTMALRGIEVEPESEKVFKIPFDLLAGLSRALIAIIAGIFIYYAVGSNLQIGFLQTAETPFTLYSFAFLAGFSESFVPNILQSLPGGSNSNSPNAVATPPADPSEAGTPAPAKKPRRKNSRRGRRRLKFGFH